MKQIRIYDRHLSLIITPVFVFLNSQLAIDILFYHFNLFFLTFSKHFNSVEQHNKCTESVLFQKLRSETSKFSLEDICVVVPWWVLPKNLTFQLFNSVYFCDKYIFHRSIHQKKPRSSIFPDYHPPAKWMLMLI